MAKVLRKIIDKNVILVLDGDVAGADTAKFYELIQKAVPEDSELIIIDLSRVDFMDSRGIGVIIKLYRKFLGQGKGMALTSLSTMVQQTFDRTRINTIFQVFLTNEEVPAHYKPLTISVDQAEQDFTIVTLKGIVKATSEQDLMNTLTNALNRSTKDVKFEVMDLWYIAPSVLESISGWAQAIVKRDRRIYLAGEEQNTAVFAANPILKDLCEIIKPSGAAKPQKDQISKVEYHKNGDFMAVKFQGELRRDGVDTFTQVMNAALIKRPKGLILDLTSATDIDSRGISAIMKAITDMKLFNARVALVHPTPRVGRILNITGVARLVNEFATESDAAKGLVELGPPRS